MIIAILSIALLGLIYIQSIYVKRGLFIQNQIFDQYVNEALVRTALKLEEAQAYNLINNTYIPDFYNTSQAINGDTDMSIEYVNGQINLDVQKDEANYRFTGTTMQEIDSLVKASNLDKEIQNELNEGLLEEYKKLLENMTMQFLYGNKNNLAIDSQLISNTLNFEFTRLGINTPFNFALIDGYTFHKIISTFTRINASTQKNSYKTPIHTNNFTGEHAILMVDFPKKKSYILKSNSTLLSFSFFFVALIAVSFGASIYIIYRQKKISELKTDFINNMTHELKTPVATISLATEMLKKEKVRQDPEKSLNYNNIISTENKRLGSHIEKVLQIAELDRNSVKLNLETADFHELINETINKFKLQFEDVQAKITVSLNATKSKVSVDENHMSNVLSNLVDNAIKYRNVERQLKIDIETKNENNKLIFIITDNGIGMNASDAKKIFTKFYRAPTGNIHNVKGFGLGLSYVKTIIDELKGEVQVKSELNKYTKFTLTLPTTK